MILIFDLNGFFEFVDTNRNSHRDLFLKNIKLFMKLEFQQNFLKSTCEDFKFWEAADLQPAALLVNELVQKYF